MDNIVAILDRSTSMGGYEKETISGYNEFIAEQLKISADAEVTLILFDSTNETIYKNVPLPEVEDLTDKIYYTKGMTALNDAIGKGIEIAEENERNKDITKTIVSIFTGGMENMSQEFKDSKLISKRVKSLEADKGGEFIYVGCDHNVHDAAMNLGMKTSNTVAISKSTLRSSLGDSTQVGYAASVANYRS